MGRNTNSGKGALISFRHMFRNAIIRKEKSGNLFAAGYVYEFIIEFAGQTTLAGEKRKKDFGRSCSGGDINVLSNKSIGKNGVEIYWKRNSISSGQGCSR